MHRFIYCFFFFSTLLNAQSKTDEYLEGILNNNSHSVFSQVIQNAGTHRLQIIYTQINRDKRNRPTFKNYYFNYDPQLYFNPASIVKMPLAFLSLEKMNSINKRGVNKYTAILFDSSQPWQRPMHKDLTSENGFPSIAHLIKRAFLISENDPYNRMYQFVGQGTIHRNLHQKGYTDVRITRQFLGLTPEQNRHTNAIRFINEEGKDLYFQPPAINIDSFDFSNEIKLGKGYMNRNDSIVNEPFDFTKHNNLSLESMQQMLQSVLFPKSVSKKQRFRLKKDDYDFLYQYLSQYPSETSYPKYDTAKFYEAM